MNQGFKQAPATPAMARTPDELAALRTITMVVYGLQALSFMMGVTAIVALVINYIKRDEVRGTLYESHFDWQIKSFWWGLLWFVVGMALAVVLVGGVVLFVAYIWMIYRVVKGWLKLMDGKPVHPA
jgi:uncharacterized membrane protein